MQTKAVPNQSANKGNWKDTQNIPKKKKLTFKEQKDWETIEDEIAGLEAAIGKLDQEMAGVASDYTRLNELMAEKEAREKELEEKMDRWMYLNEVIEEIKVQE